MPYVNVHVELDDFEDDDIVTYLIHRGYAVVKTKANTESIDEVMELFKTKNPKVCIADTVELENHMRKILLRV